MSELFARNAIMSAFVELLNKKPFDRISVVDITRLAGVSRNTFYYWYSDIYALVDALFLAETEKIKNDPASFSSWLDAFRHATRFAAENRRAVYHLYNSISRGKVERFLYDVTFSDMTLVVKGLAAGTDAAAGDIRDIAAFYSAALVALTVKWLDDGMRGDPDAHIENMARLFDGDIRTALSRSHTEPPRD